MDWLPGALLTWLALSVVTACAWVAYAMLVRDRSQ